MKKFHEAINAFHRGFFIDIEDLPLIHCEKGYRATISYGQIFLVFKEFRRMHPSGMNNFGFELYGGLDVLIAHVAYLRVQNKSSI